MLNRLISLVFLMFLASCAHVNSVSQTSIPKNKSNFISASVERNIVLMLNFDNNYLDGLTQKLISQCPKGSVKGILTKDETITYLPLIFHKSVVTASGYCVENERRKQRKQRKYRSKNKRRRG